MSDFTERAGSKFAVIRNKFIAPCCYVSIEKDAADALVLSVHMITLSTMKIKTNEFLWIYLKITGDGNTISPNGAAVTGNMFGLNPATTHINHEGFFILKFQPSSGEMTIGAGVTSKVTVATVLVNADVRVWTAHPIAYSIGANHVTPSQ